MQTFGRAGAVSDDLTELVLNRSWRPQLSVTGMAGLPLPGDAGNVLLPYTSAKLSLRIPPTLDAKTAKWMPLAITVRVQGSEGPPVRLDTVRLIPRPAG